MADIFDCDARRVGGIPFFLEGKDAQQQVEITSHFAGATFARGPDLRGNILDEPGVPIGKRSLVRADIFLEDVAEAPVEAGEIDANDGIGLAVNGELEELAQKPSELEILFQ